MSKHAEQPIPCHSVDERLEAYLDGDLQPAERRRLRLHLEACPSCDAELALAREIRGGLRSLPPQTCPPHVSVLARQQAELTAARWRRWMPFRRALMPALGMLALVVAIGLGLGYWPSPGATSQAEVEQAEQDIKLALAYLGKIGRTAGETVHQEMLETRFVGPVTKSLSAAIGGGESGDGDGR